MLHIQYSWCWFFADVFTRIFLIQTINSSLSATDFIFWIYYEWQIKQDIDLIEILFYLKKKIRVILFIIAVCMTMVLLFLYINKDNIKLSYSLKINHTTSGILVSCDSNNNFACQTTMTEDVIQRITSFLDQY